MPLTEAQQRDAEVMRGQGATDEEIARLFGQAPAAPRRRRAAKADKD